MKKQFSLILLLILGSTGYAQDYKKEIKTDFLTYMNALANGDFEQAVAYVPSEYFEIVPKSKVKEKIEQGQNNAYFEYHLRTPQILKIGEIQLIEGKYYSLISHEQRLDLKMKGQEKPDPSSTRFNAVELFLDGKFGDENVSFNKETGFFEILVAKQAYAISENGKNNWKFLDFDEDQEELLEQLLPEELIDGL